MREPRTSSPLRQITLLALRLGATAFGGPAAHIAMLEDEVVGRRGWLTRDEFLDLLGVTNLVPGPNSTEMMMQVGMRQAGPAGLCLAGIAFITPAALLTLLVAWGYVRFGRLPHFGGLLFGMKPAVLAVVLLAVGKLGRSALKEARLAMLAAAVFSFYVAGASELGLLAGAGLVGILLRRPPRAVVAWFGPLLLPAAAAASAAATPLAVGLYFLQIGSVLVGSGYVLLAFLQHGLVEQRHWITQGQLIDAIAVGQFTPGPVFCTATFIGYLAAGPAGALAGTLGIFFPGFVFVRLVHPWVGRLRESTAAAGFLDGVNAAAVALMAAVLIELAAAALRSLPAAAIFAAALLLLARTRLNSAWVVLAGAAAGYFLG
jgi:chromate transporter